MLQTSDAVTAAPSGVRQEVAPLLDEVPAGVAEMRTAAAKPALTDNQVRTIVLPWLIAAIKHMGALIGAVLLVAAFLAGLGVYWWFWTPTLTCLPDRGGMSCGYWKAPPQADQGKK